MSEMLGADVEDLRALAREFSSKATALKGIKFTLDGAVNRLPGYWVGGDSDRFANQWRTSGRLVLTSTADLLDETAKLLARNADEQEQTSSIAGSGGGGVPTPGGPGSKPGEDWWGPDWLADPDSPFRDGWDFYNTVKAFPGLRAGVYDIASMLQKSHIGDFLDSGAWKTFQNTDEFSRFFNTSNRLFEGNWHEAFNLAEDTTAFKAFNVMGKGLGVLGVGLDVLDVVNSVQDKEYGDAAYSATKALIGAGSFLPPPAGTVCMVASGALALYDNVPVIHDSVNWVGGQIADGWNSAGDALGDGLDSAGDAISDGANAVADFFGF
ncbi:WXG100 family type VII secretion target [Arthrobacter sp. 35W]|uniref:WXG100 family type VII secretion target n=1 Tax=Arthrobacter sp. 35W TaxID=1132441 RepID=UPI000425E78B|nr:WXG100 family type VII secretion target [Arthrobacter sp. 35W]